MNSQIIIGVLAGLLIGLGGGYYVASTKQSSLSLEPKHEMALDDAVASDGAMIHAMDEMSLELRGKKGAEYEQAFLEGMIVHHLGAIAMAEELLTQTERPELVAMASAIISVQADEIATMKVWLAEWFTGNQE